MTSEIFHQIGEEELDGLTKLGSASNILLIGSSSQEPAHGVCHDLGVGRRGQVQNSIYFLLTRSHMNQIQRSGAIEADIPNTLIIDALPEGGIADTIDGGGITVEPVSSPSNLTDIGIALNRYLPGMEGEQIAVCFRSITALLQYVDLKQAYQFINILTDQLASHEALTHFHLDRSAHDEQVVSTLSTLFDAVIEVNEYESTSRKADGVPESMD